MDLGHFVVLCSVNIEKGAKVWIYSDTWLHKELLPEQTSEAETLLQVLQV